MRSTVGGLPSVTAGSHSIMLRSAHIGAFQGLPSGVGAQDQSGGAFAQDCRLVVVQRGGRGGDVVRSCSRTRRSCPRPAATCSMRSACWPAGQLPGCSSKSGFGCTRLGPTQVRCGTSLSVSCRDLGYPARRQLNAPGRWWDCCSSRSRFGRPPSQRRCRCATGPRTP